MFFFLLLTSLVKTGLKLSTTGLLSTQTQDIHLQKSATWNDVPKSAEVWDIQRYLQWEDLQMPLPWKISAYQETRPLARIKSTIVTLPIFSDTSNEPTTPFPSSGDIQFDEFEFDEPGVTFLPSTLSFRKWTMPFPLSELTSESPKSTPTSSSFSEPTLVDFEPITRPPSPPEPLGTTAGASGVNATFTAPLTDSQSESVTVTDPRSSFDIIWSCLPVIFVCTWVVIHPNVPDPKDSPAKLTWRRVQLMIYALILPEAMLYWSVRQFIGARRLKRAVNSYLRPQGRPLWTLTHAHFLQMGGFAISLPNGECRPIFHDTHLEYIIIPEITVEDINDKSKGDTWSKSLVILQLLWFGVQLLARVEQGLAITELEVVTLATATLNVCMYAFWWYKPLNVNRPLLVTLKDPRDCAVWETTKPDMIAGESKKEHSTTDMKEIGTPPPSPSDAPLSARQRLRSPSSIFVSLYHRTIIHPISDMIEPIPAISTTGRKVATFHASTQLTSESEHVMDLLASVAALVYGALHCAAWAFVFPSMVEQTLWRVSCSVVLILPILYIGFVLVRWGFLGDGVKNKVIFRVVGYVCLTFYIMAILSLVVEAVLALRSYPSQAMDEIETKLLPRM